MSAEAIENVEQPYPVTVVIARRYPVLTITSPGTCGRGGLVLLDSPSRPSQAIQHEGTKGTEDGLFWSGAVDFTVVKA